MMDYRGGREGAAWTDGPQSWSWRWAWPPPGEYPIDACQDGSYDVDSVGWTFSSYNIVLTSAQVTVTRNGQPLPVDVTYPGSDYGTGNTVLFEPDGWEMQPGDTYTVRVVGSDVVEHEVEAVDCGV